MLEGTEMPLNPYHQNQTSYKLVDLQIHRLRHLVLVCDNPLPHLSMYQRLRVSSQFSQRHALIHITLRLTFLI